MQKVRYIGNYLYFLNMEEVQEKELLVTGHVQDYLNKVQESGIKSSGILHCVDAHIDAVNFMKLTVNTYF